MKGSIYLSILKQKKANKKQFALLVDPDKFNAKEIIPKAIETKVDFFLVGGSLLTNDNFEACIKTLKSQSSIPVIIFPGNFPQQISKYADGILFPSLISGRNPDLLIGSQVIAAPIIKSAALEILPTGYMLIESGKMTSALYMSNTHPIPHEKSEIAACTALAGEMLGLKLIYMDAGSGAEKCVNEKMIKKVSSTIEVPLIVGGGINNPGKAINACKAGADIIVVGNAIEKDASLIKKIAKAIHTFKK